MLSALLSQIQTQLASKRFWLASVFPLLLFLLASGWMLYRRYPAFKTWLATFEGLKEQAVLYSALAALLLALAYIFSAMNATLLEWLEGKKGLAPILRPWFYWHQQSKLAKIQKQYDETASSAIAIARTLHDCILQIDDAQAVGSKTGVCNASWKKSPEGKTVKKLLRRARRGGYISFAQLSMAVTALQKLLATNSTTIKGDQKSKALATAYSDFRAAIFYARDRSQFNRVQLYNRRQFAYPGSFEVNDPSAPEARLQNVLALTTMGNIGQTIRSYAITRYNLDLDIFWSRLQNSIQGNTNYFGLLQDVKVQVDCLVSLVWLSALFSLVWTPWMLAQGALLEFGIAGAAGLLSLWLYSLACNSYAVFADVMRSAVDLFRFKLLDDLHLGLPSRPEEESFLWERLGNITGYARKEIIQYKHSGK